MGAVKGRVILGERRDKGGGGGGFDLWVRSRGGLYTGKGETRGEEEDGAIIV